MTNEKASFLNTVAGFAQKYMRETQVPASLTIAQAILESNWGRSGLSVSNKNLFGIKGTGQSFPTQEFINGKWVTVTANFRIYETFEGSIRDHNYMIKRMKRYAAVIGEREYQKACKAIAAAGYATDPEYGDKLIRIIQTYQLTKYDDWEDEDEVEKDDANLIIKVLQKEWSKTKNADEKKELNRLANVLRKASGQPEQ